MASQEEIVDALAGMAMFADLTTPQLKGVAHIFDEAWFPAGERVLRQGLTGSAFYVILEGEAEVRVDVVARGPLRCLVLAGPQVETFLKAHPPVMFRMLQALARRLRNANRWRN